jgi:hypothetical protein
MMVGFISLELKSVDGPLLFMLLYKLVSFFQAEKCRKTHFFPKKTGFSMPFPENELSFPQKTNFVMRSPQQRETRAATPVPSGRIAVDDDAGQQEKQDTAKSENEEFPARKNGRMSAGKSFAGCIFLRAVV